METKELKIQVPEGYEIDREKSTLECIKFKPIKKDITYEDVCNKLFKKGSYYTEFDGNVGEIMKFDIESYTDRNNAINENQLEKILALNQLLNITEYYNRISNISKEVKYKIAYLEYKNQYDVHFHNIGDDIEYGVSVLFNRKEDAQAVIDNPNFREILDTIYKY